MSRLIAAAVTLALSVSSIALAKKMYWTDSVQGTIHRADLDGNNIETILSGLDNPRGIELDLANNQIYWAEQMPASIQRAGLDGSNVETVLIDGALPYNLALDLEDGIVYWVDFQLGTISRANLDGSGIEQLVDVGSDAPIEVVLNKSAGKMYWATINGRKIQRANLDGTNIENIITTDIMWPNGIALDLDAGKMYWSDAWSDDIRRANLDGSGQEDLISYGEDIKQIALDIDNHRIYWVASGGPADRIWRDSMDGGEHEVIVSVPPTNLWGLALDLRDGPVIYVDDTATGPANDGSTWCDAFVYLQDALAAADASGGNVNEIRVAQGTYKPDQGANETPGDRTASFNLLDGVALRGGYAGCGAADPDERNIDAYETVLSGDLDGNDIPVGCISDSPDCDLFGRLCVGDFCISNGNNAENSYHVVTGSGTISTAVLDGCTITAGNADGVSADYEGAGIRIVSGSPTVASCVITKNTASGNGSGMYNASNSSPTVIGCTFSRNSSDSSAGGGMHNVYNSSPTVTQCAFSTNWAISGAAMSNQNDSSPMIVDCTFNGNAAGNYGGGLFNYASDPTAVGCTFSNNFAQNSGGGIHNTQSSAPMVIECMFNGNAAHDGGGMLNTSESNPLVSNCGFFGNTAFCGGGIYNSRSSPFVMNCTFSGNSVSSLGGGMFSLDDSTPDVTNSTLSGNAALQDGGGMYFAVTDSPQVTNCILWDNIDASGGGESAQIHVNAGWPNVNYSVVQGGWSGSGGVGVVDADPQFVDRAGLDGTIGTDDDDLRLMVGSPALDAGDNLAVPADELDLDNDGDTSEPTPFDLDGNPRFKDDPLTPDTGVGTAPIVDMGAFEYQRGCLTDPDCDNLDPCDGIETCIDNVCEPGTAIVCDDGDSCNGTETCDEVGDCVAIFDADCNGNSIEDACDINGGAPDANGNGIPDECELGACCSPDGVCLELLQAECADSWTVGLSCDPNPCAFLTGVEVLGCRYMGIAPNPTGDPGTPVALRVQRLDESCPTKYVTIDSGIGRLADLPVYQTASAWSTIEVADAESVPSGTYEVRTETATNLSDPVVVVLRKWGDVIAPFGGGSQPNFADISAIVDCFKEAVGAPPLSACDIHPAIPDQVADFGDITAGVDAFKGVPFPGGPCS